MLLRLSPLLVLLSVLLACAADPPPSAAPADHPLADSLTALRADYAALRLPDALARARRLRVLLNTVAVVPNTIRAEGYQYLAMLHFDHYLTPDSIAFFAERAARLLDTHASLELLARQALCESYANYDDFAFLEMQLNARLGRGLLEEQGTPHSPLYGWLLVSEARGMSQNIDEKAPAEVIRRNRASVRRQLEYAVALFADLKLPWERYARDHLGIQLARRGEADAEFRAFTDSLYTGDDPGAAPFGFKDRLLGYWHWHHDRPDSAAYYYTRLLERAPLFFHYYEKEAYYILMLRAAGEADYARAIKLALQDMRGSDCCPPEVQDPRTCEARPYCHFFLYSLANYYYDSFHSNGRQTDLHTAFDYAAAGLLQYERSFRSWQEESVLNKNLLLGDRVISAALRTAVVTSRYEPTPDHLQAVFTAMETGRSFLLTRSLLERTDSLPLLAGTPGSEPLRAVENRLTILKATFAQTDTLTATELGEFQALTRRSRQLRDGLSEQRQGIVERSALATRVPSLNEVRDNLGPHRALIEYAESGDDIIALLVSADTTLLHVTPRKEVEQLTDRLLQLLTASAPPPAQVYAAVGQELGQLLLGPFLSTMHHDQELLLVPSASITAVPFGALLLGTPYAEATYATLPYLVGRYSLRYLESWRTELQLDRIRRARGNSASSFAVWTHPDLQGYFGTQGDALVSGTPDNGYHYMDTDCASSRFLSDAQRFSRIQLSLHAAGDPEQLNHNYLYFSKSDSLNSLLVGQLDLTASLVVLAACSTARGFRGSHEGTFSTRRSFHLAGVPDVVASVYDIPAAATSVILTEFYRQLDRNAPPAVALAGAQRACLSGSLGPRWVYPGRWAGLIAG